MSPTCMCLLAVALLSAAAVSGAPAAAPAAVTLDQVLDPMVANKATCEPNVVRTGEKTRAIYWSGYNVIVLTRWVILRVESITGNKSYLFSRTEIKSNGKASGNVHVQFQINLKGVGPIWMSDRVMYNVCGEGNETCSNTNTVNFYHTQVADYVDVSEPGKLAVDVYQHTA